MSQGIITIEQRQKQVISRLANENKKLRLENADLRFRLSELEVKLENKEQQRQDLLVKMYKANTPKGAPRPLGKKLGERGYQRRKPFDSEVTEEIKFTPTKCPYCRQSDGLGPVKETIVKYHEDIVIIPEKIVKKYVITEHWCSHCGEYVRSNKVPPDLERIGPNVMAYVLYARYRLRLPFNKIKQSLADLHNFRLSEGEIANQLEKAQELFKNDYQAICELVKIADKVYCDETGWRIRGRNFWIWVFVTDQGTRYVIEDTRGRGVPQNALGNNPDRVLISDFYAAYKNIPGYNQYCWVHLLRDSEQTESKLHDDLKDIYEQIKEELKKEVKERNKRRLDKLLREIAEKNYEAKSQALDEKIKTLQKRIAKTAPNLLTCLDFKNVLPENNTAERALRNSVVMRKIFGCSRSVYSAKVMEVNTSVIDTLLQQSPDKGFFDVILPKLKKD